MDGNDVQIASPLPDVNTKQYMWKLPDVLNLLYDPSRPAAKKVQRFHENLDAIQEVHASLWPGIHVPEAIRINISEGCFTYFLPTSMVAASLVWAISNPKRDQSSRAKTYRIFQDFIKMSCYQIEDFHFATPEATTSREDARNNADVNFQLVTATLSGENMLRPFTQSMFEEMKDCWNAETRDKSVPYHPDKFIEDSGEVPIEQFILWPLVMHKPQHASSWCITRNLRLLRVASYTLITRLCDNLERVTLPNLVIYTGRILSHEFLETDSEDEEQNMFLKSFLAEGIQDRRKKRTRRRGHAASAVTVAKAANLLYTGSESKLQKNVI